MYLVVDAFITKIRRKKGFPMIDISVERYLELLNAERILKAIRAGGINNWNCSGEAFPGRKLTKEDLPASVVKE